MNRTDLQQLADVRIAEAHALLTLAVPLPDGAYYLAGYAVECALKACIARSVNQHDFPDKELATNSFTHDLEKLVRVAGLDTDRRTEVVANPAFGRNWDEVKDWTERSRYERHALTKAQRLYDAITDAVNGILPWIKARW